MDVVPHRFVVRARELGQERVQEASGAWPAFHKCYVEERDRMRESFQIQFVHDPKCRSLQLHQGWSLLESEMGL